MLQVLPAKLGSRSLLPRSGEGEVTGRRRISTDGPVATVLASDPALPFGTRSPVVLPALLEKLQPQTMQPMQPAPTQLRRRALSNANIPLNGAHGEHTDCAANGGSAKLELAWDALPTQRLRAKEMAMLDQQIRLSAELSAPISTRSVAPAIRHAIAASGNASMGAAGAALSVPEPVSLSARPYSSSARGAARPSSCAGVPPATAPPSTAPPSTAPPQNLGPNANAERLLIGIWEVPRAPPQWGPPPGPAPPGLPPGFVLDERGRMQWGPPRGPASHVAQCHGQLPLQLRHQLPPWQAWPPQPWQQPRPPPPLYHYLSGPPPNLNRNAPVPAPISARGAGALRRATLSRELDAELDGLRMGRAELPK